MPDADTTHSDVVTQLTRERADLIERLSEARSILSYCKGMLEAEQLMNAKGLGVTFTNVQETALRRINDHLDAGLFGNNAKKGD
jgi:hypothetical protein